MRRLSDTLRRYLREGRIVPVNLLWVGARDRDTGDLMQRGLSDREGDRSFQVLVGDTVQEREYWGDGSLVSVGNIVQRTGLVAQTLTIRLTTNSEVSRQLIRVWSVQRAPVELHTAYLDPDTREPIEPAMMEFSGFVDEPSIPTPSEGREEHISLKCANHVQELRRASSEKRSDASQQARASGDTIYKYIDVCHRLKIPWGDGDRQ